MRRSRLAGLAAVAMLGGILLTPATPAHADTSTLYVKKLSTACSDTGPGTSEQPFCTIGAAAAVVTAGQTVEISGGTYPERVTITTSGTPDQPIIFRAAPTGGPTLVGANAGIVVDGQHDIRIERIRVNRPLGVPALVLRNSSDITVDGGSYVTDKGATAPAIRLSGVTRSTLTRMSVHGMPLLAGVAMDDATSGVTISSVTVSSGPDEVTSNPSVGIQARGAGNRVVNNQVSNLTGAAIEIGPGATGTVVANNRIDGGIGYGIHNHSASGTAITNNTVRDRCVDGIRVDGSSTRTSVQNNVLYLNGRFSQTYCYGTPLDGVELGVYGDAVRDTVVDYNNAHHYVAPSPAIYNWNGTRMSLTAFRAASGQAAHDRETGFSNDSIDSANSAAPGYQATDRGGAARADDPAVANTGVGPVTYADRGATEVIRSPVARFSTALDLGAGTLTLDASASEAGFAPIASYRFSFGDGTTVTQPSPVATHRYAKPGDYFVIVEVIGTDGRSHSVSREVSVLRRIAAVGLLSVVNLHYVGSAYPPTVFRPNQTTLNAAAQFDLADAGNGQVALFSRTNQRYLGTNTLGSETLTATKITVDDPERFALLTNSDGTVSIRSAVNGRYVTTDAYGMQYLIPEATAIGPGTKFYRVNIADANRALRQAVSKRFVTADPTGTYPLAATSTTVGANQRFDVADLGNGQVGLFAHANRRFVMADGAGGKPLIARAALVGSWERFALVRNTDGTVSLRAAVNNRYVTAGTGTSPLIANRTTIGFTERFVLR